MWSHSSTTGRSFAVRRAALLLTALSVCVSPRAVAQETDDLPGAFAACRQLAADHKWKAARAAYKDLFEAFPGDRRLVSARTGIERDLQQCEFALGRHAPTGQDLFGPAVREFSAAGRKIDLWFARGIEDPAWEKVTDGLGMLPLRFEPYVSISVPATGKDTKLEDDPPFDDELRDRVRIRAILSYEFGDETGYLVTTPYGHYGSVLSRSDETPEDLRTETPADCRVFRLGEDPPVLVKYGMPTGPRHRRREIPAKYRWFRISQNGPMIRVETDGMRPFEARDGKYQGGYVALSTAWRAEDRIEPLSVRVEGTLDRDFVVQRLAQYDAEAFERWKTHDWDADAVLPQWLLDGATTTMTSDVAVPDDMPDDLRDELEPLLRLVRFGEWREGLTFPDLATLPPKSHALMEGVVALIRGNRLGAEASFTRLHELAPEYAHALLWRARARFLRRDLVGAHADLEAARANLVDDPAYHELLARLRLAAGELAEAGEALGAARDSGIWTDELEKMAARVEAASRGPQWKHTFRKQVGPFEIRSDHSMRACQRVGQLLYDGVIRYAKTFRPVPEERQPARVYVFSSHEAYDAYAAELGMSLAHSAGAYIPRLHILVLWMPKDEHDFEVTVRHEGFHQYAHHFAEDLPLWFNEGWAEYFGNVAAESRGFGHETDRTMLARAVVANRARFVPLRNLLRMPQAEFMSDAAPRYVQAWAAVTFLAESDDPLADGALSRYFEHLVSGRSPAEAYREVFAATEPRLQSAFDGFLDELVDRGR